MTDQKTEVKTEVKPELQHVYHTDQQVSVNAYFEADVNGETVKFQITSRYGSTTAKIVSTTEALVTAYSMLRAMFPKPAPPPIPTATIPMTDETGVPVVDSQTGQAVQALLPAGVRLYTVAGVAHDQTKTGKDVMKVWTVEEPYGKGYGVSCFHPPAEFADWKKWALMSKDNKVHYMPPKGFEKVIIRDPQKEGGYPDVIEFRPA
jgi:hypothetical protein